MPAGYELTDDQSRIDVEATHAYLARSYWAKGIPLETVRRALANSLCVAVRHADAQVGFARVITDYATFAWLADVHVLEDHRGRGLSKVMVTALQDHPLLQGLRRWGLHTLDAQDLYAQLGWRLQANPGRMMERVFTDLYPVPA
ncbi:GNAT family N-acetyltransferase [Altererythrobacter aestuarii]|uniref:GNAT family N-acetyltransferase n=1 Tax=Alteraurantiacibacter aestuarii TaxID=650004 RepID=A0A844ZJE4_9SPHN|nr:GNAT family N-acetyltransferase [Alteraurantiacibacter aestuarii]